MLRYHSHYYAITITSLSSSSPRGPYEEGAGYNGDYSFECQVSFDSLTQWRLFSLTQSHFVDGHFNPK